MNPQRTILVVDDAIDIRLILKKILTDAGYKVLVAEDGTEGLQVAQAEHPDLIFLDIMMPGIHGIEVLRAIKSDPDLHQTGVIMCSAKSYKPEQDQAIKLGAFTFITKPFEIASVLQTVADFFGRRSATPPPAPTIIATDVEPYLPYLRPNPPHIRFWGTRGSIPVSGQAFTRHGGNTPCIEVSDGANMIIVDAGTGIRELGNMLLKNIPDVMHLFIGHTHWDHIQGFPFFGPAYFPGKTINVYGAAGFGKDLRSVFGGQLDADYFPVQLSDMLSKIEFHQLTQNPIVIGSMKIWWEYVNHPGAAVGFKFLLNGKRVIYISDNEFLKGYLGPPDLKVIPKDMLLPYEPVIDFIRDADLLITESQYPNDEYAKKIGWGHTCLSNGCLLAKLGNVKRWLVTHHDPNHDDVFLARKLQLTRQILDSIGCPIPVSHAFDGHLETF